MEIPRGIQKSVYQPQALGIVHGGAHNSLSAKPDRNGAMRGLGQSDARAVQPSGSEEEPRLPRKEGERAGQNVLS